MLEGHRWSEKDRFGNEIYLTEERWMHITGAENHPEMLDYEIELHETIRAGKRRQEMVNPQKYRYSKEFDELTLSNTYIVAVVKLGLIEDVEGQLHSNNFIITAYQKKIW